MSFEMQQSPFIPIMSKNILLWELKDVSVPYVRRESPPAETHGLKRGSKIYKINSDLLLAPNVNY